MKRLLPIAAIACTVFSTLTMLVFMMAGAANSTPEQLRSMKWWAGSLSLVSVVCVIAGIVLLRKGRTGQAALVAFLPTGILFWIFVWLMV